MAEVAPGEYRVQLNMTLHGLWQLVLPIRHRDELHEVRVDTWVAAQMEQQS